MIPRRGDRFVPPRFFYRTGKIRHTSQGDWHILVYKPLTKEVIIMPEQDERRTAPAQGEKREDVDDLIFRTAPSWPVSDR